jgi:hypothetical protein
LSRDVEKPMTAPTYPQNAIYLGSDETKE